MAEPFNAEDFREEEPPFDAADPKAVNSARKKAVRIRKKRLNFVKTMMNDPEGRLWVYDLIVNCHTFGNPLVLCDPYATHFNIGMANVGKMVLADINEAAPEKYMQMMREGQTER